MYKKHLLLALALGAMTNALHAQQGWKIVPGKITTSWSEKVSPTDVLPEYPRPQLVRDNWKNLNGLWDYAVKPKAESTPTAYDGKILVPFAVESALSGVGKTVGKDSILWYHTSVGIPANMKGKKILLHFGASDWRTTVYVNGKEAGTHEGGFDPFTFDITPLLKTDKQDIIVRIWDPTNEGPQPRGKQVRNPEGIWYTPVTGIWQTVWLEAVPDTYIAGTRQTPDIDQQTLTVNADVQNLQPGDKVTVTAYDGAIKVAEGELSNGTAVLKLSSQKLWSPDNPFLYNLQLEVNRKGKAIDQVKSYFAMRKSSVGKDANGIQRMLLNNKFVFQFGPLDQGWWPDGLYTAPTDEALKYDIAQTKAMGFNMIRKHIKVEPARWYYYCDKLGMLVWQDMPSGDLGNGWEPRPGIIDKASDKNRSPESEGYYKKEWEAIINALYNYPSIIVWTPFNEAWGQFKTEEITEWTMRKDPSRLVNTASGGNFYPVGPIIDLHNYPEPAMPDPAIYGDKRAIVLGEYGGLGLPVEGHVWQQRDNWGYQNFKNADDLFKRYSLFVDRLEMLISKGLSAAVYTQTTDVEVEVNGLMTYDRKVQKIPVEKLQQIHQKLFR
ncbi:MAG TPA: glycoside hydrolase family 2 TIM barrel-domain containing protein [Chitinophaga sp.]|uniref:glycoside hydrolase family 2 protein n=1 Tax=Chitinophaga sp. TaxID=1869181 RepID=UPI002D0DD940|nr:sugar-binding domain-containing protein [Chitinophaga sp.]HVI44032.1 glycoside hydrolase family 2 TIM barrel-domain containing protein [Chitinophaga sp.]